MELDIFKIIDSDTNRSFLYGDGFFDTLLIDNLNFKNYDIHYQRNFKSAQILGMEWKNEWTTDYFLNLIKEIYSKSSGKTIKLRFTFYRNSYGGYSPENNSMGFSIKIEPYLIRKPKILKTCIYKKSSKQCNFFSNIKSTSALLYVMAALEMKKNECDEIIILNEFGRICESLNSNIYIKKNNVFYTPPLSEGCVDGTFRTQMLKGDFGYNVIEKPLKIEELNEYEFYFSNAVKGLTSGILI
ncbi:MAG: aminotransferase class IV [Bacteroidetes bacterium]|nr:aminotransferase class IV [Bacteroidota bacterium]